MIDPGLSNSEGSKRETCGRKKCNERLKQTKEEELKLDKEIECLEG